MQRGSPLEFIANYDRTSIAQRHRLNGSTYNHHSCRSGNHFERRAGKLRVLDLVPQKNTPVPVVLNVANGNLSVMRPQHEDCDPA